MNQSLVGTGEDHFKSKLLADRVYVFTVDVPVRISFAKEGGLSGVVKSTSLVLGAGSHKIRALPGLVVPYVAALSGTYNASIEEMSLVANTREDIHHPDIIMAMSDSDDAPAHRRTVPLMGTGSTPAVSGKLIADRRYSVFSGETAITLEFSGELGGDKASYTVTLPPFSQFNFRAIPNRDNAIGRLYVYCTAEDGSSSFAGYLVNRDY